MTGHFLTKLHSYKLKEPLEFLIRGTYTNSLVPFKRKRKEKQKLNLGTFRNKKASTLIQGQKSIQGLNDHIERVRRQFTHLSSGQFFLTMTVCLQAIQYSDFNTRI